MGENANLLYRRKSEQAVKYLLVGMSSWFGGGFMADIILKAWYLEQRGYATLLRGIVSGHPKLEDGAFIHTSPVKQAVIEADHKCLKAVTASGSNYTVAFEDIDFRPDFIERTEECLQTLNISTTFIDEAVILSRQKEEAFQELLDRELSNGDLYLEVGESSLVKVYFKYHDEILRLHGRCHVGMFADSYLYTETGVVDFRHYEFGWRSFTTYHMSDTIQRLVINNVSGDVMRIDEKEYPVGKTITCVTRKNHEEGLLSPDMVNGKSLFSDHDPEKEE